VGGAEGVAARRTLVELLAALIERLLPGRWGQAARGAWALVLGVMEDRF